MSEILDQARSIPILAHMDNIEKTNDALPYNPKSHLDHSSIQQDWKNEMAKSNDFIKWEYLPAALAPDCQYDHSGVFSGSAIQDGQKHIPI